MYQSTPWTFAQSELLVLCEMHLESQPHDLHCDLLMQNLKHELYLERWGIKHI